MFVDRASHLNGRLFSSQGISLAGDFNGKKEEKPLTKNTKDERAIVDKMVYFNYILYNLIRDHCSVLG